MASSGDEMSIEARILLQPIATPRILGLYGFAGAWLVIGAYMAKWYGSSQTPLYLFPIVGFLGGVAQFIAAIWAYRARDGLATAVMGFWGSFWLSYGLLEWLFAAGELPRPAGAFPEYGFWYIVAAWITAATAAAALAVSWSLFAPLLTAAVGSTVAAVAFFRGSNTLTIIAGYLFLLTALLAWYDATAVMLRSAYGREVLPTWPTTHARRLPAVDPGAGEPGVSKRQ